MADQESRRFERRQERIDRVRAVSRPARVRVLPRDDNLRKILKHPMGTNFPAQGSAEWPFDQFTKRRIQDGDVTIEEAAPAAAKAEAPKETKAGKPSSS